MSTDDSTQVAGVDFGDLIDAIHKLQRAIRERDELIQQLLRANVALRFRLDEERKSIEF